MLRKTVKHFEDMLKVEVCASINTIKAYKSDVEKFLLWCKGDLYEDALKMYVFETQNQVSNSTLRRRVSSIVGWMKFCNSCGMKINLNIPKLKNIKGMPSIMSNEDLNKMRMAAQYDQSEHGIRLRCLIEILYSTGARISELLSIRHEDISSVVSGKSNSINIIGKGNKERRVFLTSEAVTELRYYCQKCGVWNGSLWSKTDKISRQLVHRWLKKLAHAAGVSVEKVFPHSFRHRLATNLVQNGMNLIEVQKILGHANINTTSIYTQLEDDVIYKMVLDKLG